MFPPENNDKLIFDFFNPFPHLIRLGKAGHYFFPDNGIIGRSEISEILIKFKGMLAGGFDEIIG
jgi:hypothetical protein